MKELVQGVIRVILYFDIYSTGKIQDATL
jgi:hypothetical protein